MVVAIRTLPERASTDHLGATAVADKAPELAAVVC
jgi:hypothetical protein